ncbi:MAG: hypothetical protein RLZZ501_352 [Pseudomonadota bacterium]
MDIATLLLSLGIDPGLIIAATGAVTLASGIDALFPPSAKGSAWYWPRRLLSLLALNVRHARNAGAVPAPAPGTGRPPVALALALVAAGGLSACAEYNAAIGAANTWTAEQIAAQKSNVQGINDNAVKAWADLGCAIPYGALARNGSGYTNLPKAVVLLCGAPSGMVITSQTTLSAATSTTSE